MKQTKKHLFQNIITKGDNVLCVDAMEITVAGGLSFWLYCSAAVAADAAITVTAITTTAAAVDAVAVAVAAEQTDRKLRKKNRNIK